MQAEQKQWLGPNDQIDTGEVLDVRMRPGSQTQLSLEDEVSPSRSKGLGQDHISDKKSQGGNSI